jgi:hypothetical protein
MTGELPRDLAGLSTEQLDEAREETDARLTPLFRRWPALGSQDMAELRHLYAERLRLARHLGFLRKHGVRHEDAASNAN